MSRWRGLVAEYVPRVVLAAVVWHRFPQVFWIDGNHYWHAFRGGGLPYRDFLWEFPPLTVVPMLLAVLPLAAFGVALAAVMAACELGSLELLRRGRADADALTRYWTRVVWAIALYSYFRFDFLSVVCAVAALTLWERRRSGSGAIVLGFAAKLWPASLLVIPVVQRRTREVVVAVGGIVVVVAVWFAWSPHGFREFLDFRRGAGIQVESLFGPVALLTGSRPTFVSGAWVVGAGTLDWMDTALLAVLAAAVVGLAAIGWRNRDAVRVHALGGAVVTCVLLFSRLLSPQFLAWVLPFAALDQVEGRGVAARWFALAVFVTLPPLVWYAELLDGNRLLEVVLLARNVALVCVAAAFVGSTFRPRTPAGPA